MLDKENEERNRVGKSALDTYRNNFHLANKKNRKLWETTAAEILKKPPIYAIINLRVSKKIKHKKETFWHDYYNTGITT